MTGTTLPAVTSDVFKAVTTRNEKSLVLVLSGTADLRAQSGLETYLFQINEIALSTEVPEVVVDIRRLEFLNSSCFKAFVSWVGQLQEIEHTRQYRIRFLSDARLLWQRRSLHALSCFAVDLITVESS